MLAEIKRLVDHQRLLKHVAPVLVLDQKPKLVAVQLDKVLRENGSQTWLSLNKVKKPLHAMRAHLIQGYFDEGLFVALVTQHLEYDLFLEVGLGFLEVGLHEEVGVSVGHQPTEAVLVGDQVAQQY